MGKYLFEQRLQGDVSFQSTYLQALLSWVNAPFREEQAHHKKYDTHVWTFPALNRERCYPKEAWLVETVQAELTAGRRVLIYLRQTGEKDIQPRLVDVLKQHLPQAKASILPSSIEPKQRETRVQAEVARGVNVLICNPLLVQTGLDLCAFPTIIFYEPNYSLYVMMQASRRAWRIIQDQPCRTYYPYYEGTLEAQAMALMAKKQRASEVLYGQTDGAGLSDLVSGGGDDLLKALMRCVEQETPLPDVQALFRREGERPRSPWEVLPNVAQPSEEGIPLGITLGTMPLPAVVAADVIPVQSVMDMQMVAVAAPHIREPERAEVTARLPKPQPLPPKPPLKRRKKVKLSEAPADAVLPPVTLPVVPASSSTPRVRSQPTVSAQQLTLF
jgi:hypothetical protein